MKDQSLMKKETARFGGPNCFKGLLDSELKRGDN